MSRALFLRVMLSLLLLVSQQTALTHAMSHWAATDQVAQLDDASARTPSKGNLHDAGCAQCLNFAQLATAIGSPSYTVPVLDIAATHQRIALPSDNCIRTVCVFQSRAPPPA